MNIIRGKQQITTYKNIEASVDFDNLLKYQGERRGLVRLELKAAQIFQVITLLLLLLSFGLIVLEGNLSLTNILFPSTLVLYLPYLAVFSYLIAIYLGRDRNEFDDNLEHYD